MFDPCNPRQMTIALPRHPDPDITIWPTCTRAMRCGGCCTSDVFSCEPTEIREKFVKVIFSQKSVLSIIFDFHINHSENSKTFDALKMCVSLCFFF